MALTTAQQATLKADILANATLNAYPNTADGAFDIAIAYNAAASPAFTVWKTSVGVSEIMSNGFVWTAVDAMTVGKARIWDWMQAQGTINPSKANVRQGLVDAFGAGSAMATGIAPHLKRLATRVEKLYATGTGTDAAPGTLVFEGALSYRDVESARNS